MTSETESWGVSVGQGDELPEWGITQYAPLFQVSNTKCPIVGYGLAWQKDGAPLEELGEKLVMLDPIERTIYFGPPQRLMYSLRKDTKFFIVAYTELGKRAYFMVNI